MDESQVLEGNFGASGVRDGQVCLKLLAHEKKKAIVFFFFGERRDGGK